MKILKVNNKNGLLKAVFCIFFGTFFSTIILSTNCFFAEKKTTLKNYKIDKVSKISNPFIDDENYRIVYLTINPRDHKIFIIKADKSIEILDYTKALQVKLSEGFLGFSTIEDFKIVLK